ncbi:MAG: RhuM family protein [Planctomycetota bacterium]
MTEFPVEGFTLDDERLKNPPALARPTTSASCSRASRDIRSSERVFYRKVLEIYATSIDYDPRAESSQLFFKTVQKNPVGEFAAPPRANRIA